MLEIPYIIISGKLKRKNFGKEYLKILVSESGGAKNESGRT